MDEVNLPKGAQAKLAVFESNIADNAAQIESLRVSLKEAVYRQQETQITTLGAMIKSRQIKLDADKQSLARFRDQIAALQIAPNTRLVDVDAPVPVDGETLESVRLEISTLRRELHEIDAAPDSEADMRKKITASVYAIPEFKPERIRKDGGTDWHCRTRHQTVELWSLGHDALIEKRLATYMAQLGDRVAVAEKMTRTLIVNNRLDDLTRLEAAMVQADPESTHNLHAPIFAFLGIEAVTKRRAA